MTLGPRRLDHVAIAVWGAGGVVVQPVQPLQADTDLARSLEANGEGLHHLCCHAPDPLATAAGLADAGDPPPKPGRGRRGVSAFVPGTPRHGVLVEFTASAASSSPSA